MALVLRTLFFFSPPKAALPTTTVLVCGIFLTPSPVRSQIRNQGRRFDDIPNANKLRIIAGSARGKRLESPDVYLRPMMGKVRGALFSTLTSMGLFEPGAKGAELGCTVLDIFAGSGSIGLEALSRGASQAAFVDLSPACCLAALNNADACGFGQGRPHGSLAGDYVCAVQGDALEVLRNPRHFVMGGRLLETAPFRLVTLTPPYEEISYPV